MAAAHFENRVLESSTSMGIGMIALQAVAGWRRFADVLAVAETCHYVITAVDRVGRSTGDVEWGIGTFAANNMLARTTVIGSSNAGAKVVFTEGTKMSGNLTI